MARLYHPDTGHEYECPDDEGLLGELAKAGWLPAPEPEAVPGHEPEPVRYVPVSADQVDRSALEQKKKDELVALAEDRGLDTSGNKSDLVDRLVGEEPEPA